MTTEHLDALKEALDVCDGTQPDHDNPLIAVTLERLMHPAEALDLQAVHGGPWGEHPPLESGRSISVDDWACEVGAGNTRLGYWEWAAKQLELDREEACEEECAAAEADARAEAEAMAALEAEAQAHFEAEARAHFEAEAMSEGPW
jgi:hypothetical protein